MLRYCFVLCLVVLFGCASTSNMKLTSKNIGVFIPNVKDAMFCYAYIGGTVFHNIKSKSLIESDYAQSYEKSVSKAGRDRERISTSLTI